MRNPQILVAIIASGLACYRPTTVTLRPESFLKSSAARAYQQPDGQWLVVVELPNPDGTRNWTLGVEEPADIQLVKDATITRAQWHVTEERWESGQPFRVRITLDNGSVIPVTISYSKRMLHPIVWLVLSLPGGRF